MENEIHVKPCVVERIVDENGIEMARHGLSVPNERAAMKKAAFADEADGLAL